MELFENLRQLCNTVAGEGVLDDLVSAQRKVSLRTGLKIPALDEIALFIREIKEDKEFGITL